MNFNFICFALLIGANYSYAASITLTKRSTDDNLLFGFIKKFFEEKCQEEKNVTDVLVATAKCLKGYIPTNTDDLKNTVNLNAMSQVCSDSKEALKLINCFNEFNYLLEECTIPAEKYLKSFFIKAVRKVIDTICNETTGTDGAGGTVLYRVLYSPKSIECFEKMSLNYNMECSEQQIFNSHTTISKSLLCGDFDQMNNCYKNYLSQQCPAANELKKLFTETMKSIKSSCYAEVQPKPKVKVNVTPRYTVRPVYVSEFNPIVRTNPLDFLPSPQTSTMLVAGAGLALLPAIPLFFG